MRLVRAAAALIASVGVLTACSDGGTPSETLPSTSASGSAEPSETLKPLGPPDMPMPVEAREQTATGAEAFIRYYMALYTAAQASMDPSYMSQLSQDCETCDRIIEEIHSDGSAGYKYQGGQISVAYVDAAEPDDSRAELVFSVTQAPLNVVDAKGLPIADLVFPERKSPGCGAILGWSQAINSWILNQWDIN
jgi:hypothetical protein